MNTIGLTTIKNLLGIAVCLGLGTLSGMSVQVSDSNWYQSLVKPIFTPPSYLFGPVWTLLYILMGITLILIWEQRTYNPTLFWLFGLQLILNIIWSPLFFYLQRIDLALGVLIGLWITLVLCLVLSWKNKIIFALLLPYTIWVSFAGILNFYIFLLN